MVSASFTPTNSASVELLVLIFCLEELLIGHTEILTVVTEEIKKLANKALEVGADIVIMLHTDYQCTPKLIHSISYLLANGLHDVVLA